VPKGAETGLNYRMGKQVLIPGRSRDFSPHPDQLWIPPYHLSNGYQW